jgi:ribose-phosphate pyrophosphokinase
MDDFLIFFLPGNKQLAEALESKLNIKIGSAEIRYFPDEETYIRIDSDVKNKKIILICSLHHPNNQAIPLMFVAKTLKILGAAKVCLVAPYLPYMRQDKCFNPGESVTSQLFGKFISGFIDSLITIDPHLHRIHVLSEIYSAPIILTLTSTNKISTWIRDNVESPFIIGPDEESKQWVSEVAKNANASFAIIKKIRYGDRKVSISVPDINDTSKTPVLVDDIISTGTTMLAAIQQLLLMGFKNPICICVHALFNNEVYKSLLNAGAQAVITCDTIPHYSNKIEIIDIIAEAIATF